jgi:hypothetical protein
VDERVARGNDGDGQDDAEGDQLRGNLLEGAQTLGDGVGCGLGLWLARILFLDVLSFTVSICGAAYHPPLKLFSHLL